MIRLAQRMPRSANCVFREDFLNLGSVQDNGGVVVAATVDRGLSAVNNTARVTYAGTESLRINATTMTVCVRLRTTGSSLASNPILAAKQPNALNDNQFAVVLASGTGGRPYFQIANAPSDFGQYALSTEYLALASEYALFYVYDGALAAASRARLFAANLSLGAAVAELAKSNGGTIPAAMRVSAPPLSLFNYSGAGGAAAPPTDVVMREVLILGPALSLAEMQDYAYGLTYQKVVP